MADLTHTNRPKPTTRQSLCQRRPPTLPALSLSAPTEAVNLKSFHKFSINVVCLDKAGRNFTNVTGLKKSHYFKQLTI